MFEKIGRLAERAANGASVSRRGFLGRLGQSALGFAGVLAGLAATTASAKGAASYVCCVWKCPRYYPRGGKWDLHWLCLPAGGSCTPYAPYPSCKLSSQKNVTSCTSCP